MAARPRGLLAVLATLLLLPAGSGLAQDWIYPIREGDTPWSICLEYTNKAGCWIELSKYNNIERDRRIPLGTEVRVPIDWLVRVPEVGTVVSLQGDVSYESRSGAAASPLQAGQALLLGSRVIAREGTASLRFVSGSQLLLRPHSELELNSLSTRAGPGAASELILQRGEVDVQVQPDRDTRFEVQTPSAIAAVRGTSYRLAALDSGGEATRGEVLTGAVDVEAGTSARVEAGYGVLAKRGEPVSPPRKLLAAPTIEAGSERGPLPLTLRWGADPEAVSWRLDIYDPGRGGAPLETRESPEPRLTFSALELRCYRVVLRAVDGQGFNGLQTDTPLCAEPTPPPPPPEPVETEAVVPYLM